MVVGSEKIKLPEALLLNTPSLPFPPLQRGALTTLQVNLGYRCNESCGHCHVSAGPTRAEMLSAELVPLMPSVLERQAIRCLDLILRRRRQVVRR